MSGRGRRQTERDGNGISKLKEETEQRHGKPAVATGRHCGTTTTVVERPLLSPAERCSTPGAEETVPSGRVVLARGAGLCETQARTAGREEGRLWHSLALRAAMPRGKLPCVPRSSLLPFGGSGSPTSGGL